MICQIIIEREIKRENMQKRTIAKNLKRSKQITEKVIALQYLDSNLQRVAMMDLYYLLLVTYYIIRNFEAIQLSVFLLLQNPFQKMLKSMTTSRYFKPFTSCVIPAIFIYIFVFYSHFFIIHTIKVLKRRPYQKTTKLFAGDVTAIVIDITSQN